MARERRTTRRRRGRAEEEPEEVEVEKSDVEEVEVEKEVPVEVDAPPRRSPRTLTEPVAETSSVDPLEIELTDLWDQLENGGELVVSKRDDVLYVSTLATKLVGKAGKKSKGRLPKDFNKSIRTEEYWEWSRTDWGSRSYEEKIAYAKELGAEWEPHDHMQTEMMRVVPAVCAKLEIEKYREGYRTRQERATAKELARAGLPY